MCFLLHLDFPFSLCFFLHLLLLLFFCSLDVAFFSLSLSSSTVSMFSGLFSLYLSQLIFFFPFFLLAFSFYFLQICLVLLLPHSSSGALFQAISETLEWPYIDHKFLISPFLFVFSSQPLFFIIQGYKTPFLHLNNREITPAPLHRSSRHHFIPLIYACVCICITTLNCLILYRSERAIFPFFCTIFPFTLANIFLTEGQNGPSSHRK